MPPNSLVFCDEALLKTDNTQTGKNYDWTKLKNSRAEDNVFLVLSFKPIVELSTRNFIPVNVKWPEEADVITLSRSYRQSVTLFNTLQGYHSQGVRVLDAKVNPVDIVQGPEPFVFYYDGEVTNDMKAYLLSELEKYSPDEVMILFTKNKKSDAMKLFEKSKFRHSLTLWTSFIGCEAPFVIMFFSEDDKNWEFMEMASRAQYKVFFQLLVANVSDCFKFYLLCSSMDTLLAH